MAPMRVTSIGHAGLLIETRHASIVCDPWFVPAFFGSWFVFPRNDRLPDDLRSKMEHHDYLYVSHIHADHLDVAFLREHIDRATTILLPDFPTSEMADILRSLGFHRFLATKDGVPISLSDGLDVMILTETSMTDGPGGDSALLVSDGTARLMNQNDCRPLDLHAIERFGPIDVHVLQYSGAIWYPIVYEETPERLAELGAAKRRSQFARALRYVAAVGAPTIVPAAGPPCFLDPDLFAFNDTTRDPTSTFPDATVFIAELAARGFNGVLTTPGTTIDVADGSTTIIHPAPDAEVRRPFDDKESYLREYQGDWAAWLDAEKASWSPPRAGLVERLAKWWTPLLAQAPTLREMIGTNALLRLDDLDIVVDFPAGEVREWNGEPYLYRFLIDRRLVETCVDRHAVDWSNALFLSCRFKAWRGGDYNEYLYNFFKMLSPERIARAETQARADQARLAGEGTIEEIELDGWLVERWCPHNSADLAEFGSTTNGVLTCAMHGWRFDLATGRCLNSDKRRLRSRRA